RLEVVASKKKKLERFGMNKSEDGFRFKLNKHLVGYHNTVREEIVLDAPESFINWNIPPPPPLRHHGPLLQLDGVYFTYPNSSKQVLRNVSLSISPNSRIGFVGANGD
ncbi:11930_t:CDS:2, partial [Acaulospora morrowiae]